MLAGFDMNGSYDLRRFVDAQRGIYEQALAELREGRKRSHWMWFIFPQIAGLGSSPTARHYAIASLAEARAYLEHAVLGERLRTCTDATNAHAAREAHEIFGSPDDMKFRSSMTLFGQAAPEETRFRTALDLFYRGEQDLLTLERLRSG